VIAHSMHTRSWNLKQGLSKLRTLTAWVVSRTDAMFISHMVEPVCAAICVVLTKVFANGLTKIQRGRLRPTMGVSDIPPMTSQ
jgi:hypothetical protein